MGGPFYKTLFLRERDFYVFLNHPYKTFVDLLDLSKNFRNRGYKTLSSDSTSKVSYKCDCEKLDGLNSVL